MWGLLPKGICRDSLAALPRSCSPFGAVRMFCAPSSDFVPWNLSSARRCHRPSCFLAEEVGEFGLVGSITVPLMRAWIGSVMAVVSAIVSVVA